MSSFPIARTFCVPVIRSRWQPSQTLERAAAVALLVVSSPVLLISAIAIRALSGRSPFVAHCRVGFQGEPLWVFKLRTMWAAPAREPFRLVEYLRGGRVEFRKTKLDPRVTSRFAAFCRRHSVDELPQLWHVVRGQLSLVGPRPITAREMELYYANATEILSARPGLTGLWQVSGRASLTYSQRRRLDLFLVRKFSPALYARILLKTPFCLLSGNGAW